MQTDYASHGINFSDPAVLVVCLVMRAKQSEIGFVILNDNTLCKTVTVHWQNSQ